MLTFNRNDLIEFGDIYARNGCVGNKRKKAVLKSEVCVLNNFTITQMLVEVG